MPCDSRHCGPRAGVRLAGIEIVARPPPQFLAVQTWSDVAEDETEVTTSAGHALHLPVIPASDGRELDFDAWRVTVNGTPTHLEPP